MRSTLTLLGAPKSTQHVYKYACRGPHPSMYMTSEGKALKEDYAWQAKGQWHDKPLTGPIALTAHFYFPTRRKFDLDNANKLWLDALSGIVFEDDKQVDDLHLIRDYDPQKPRIEIFLRRLPE